MTLSVILAGDPAEAVPAAHVVCWLWATWHGLDVELSVHVRPLATQGGLFS